MTEAFEIQSLIFVVILIIYVLASHLIETKKVPYLHQSSIAIFMGMLTALFLDNVFEVPITFSNQIFFAIILPPIIFSAGYSLRKSLFFENLGMASFLGIIGTIMGFVCLTAFLTLVNKLLFKQLHLPQLMMISSVLCATDTVAALSLIKPKKYPVLNAVLFGQSMLNDAVAIILFRTVNELEFGENGELTMDHVVTMIISFSYLFLGSVALGVVTGFGLSYLFKINQSFAKHPIKQTSLILLNGYFTYLFGEMLTLSGIISLFTCAIIMGHYCFMNISEESQKGTGLAFQTVSHIAEAFVFAYLGASVLSVRGYWSAIGMAIIILIALPFIRAIMVYSLPILYKILRKKFPITSKELKVCWYSGLIRGVIAFALCLQIKQSQVNRNFLVNVTLVIVMTTTLLGSTMMKSFANFIGIEDNDDDQQETQYQINEQKMMQVQPSSNYKSIGGIQQNELKIGLNKEIEDKEKEVKNFQWFQKEYIKPIFEKKQKLNYELQEINPQKQLNLAKTQFQSTGNP